MTCADCGRTKYSAYWCVLAQRHLCYRCYCKVAIAYD
jgi:hypothetical protein